MKPKSNRVGLTVKVQISITTTEPVQQVLIYDRKMRHIYQGPATEEIVAIMDSRLKAFFKAIWHRDRNVFELMERVPDKNW